MQHPGRRRVARGHGVQEHDIEPQRLEPLEEIGQRARPQHHLDPGIAEQGAQEPQLEVARQRGKRAHAQDLAGAAASRKRGHKLVAGCEDAVGMVKRDAPGLGEVEPAAAPVEERLPQPVLERLDLHRKRRLRHAQLLGCAREVAVMRDRPEGPEVKVVQPPHRSLSGKDTGEALYRTSRNTPDPGAA